MVMKNKYAALTVLVITALILAGSAYYFLSNTHSPTIALTDANNTASTTPRLSSQENAQKSAADMTNIAVISPQRLMQTVTDYGPAPRYPDSVEVKISSGNAITVKKVFESPSGNGNNFAIYEYQNHLYKYLNGNFTSLQNSDASTYVNIESPFSFEQYAKDKNNVYCYGDILVGADPATFDFIPAFDTSDKKFHITNDKYLVYQDKNHQYIYGECKPYEGS
jgi:hypothetical protein